MNFFDFNSNKFPFAIFLLFAMGYALGFVTGNLNGENKGLRAQDTAVIKALGVTNARIQSDLIAANKILTEAANVDTTGKTKGYIVEAIKRYKETKK